MKRSGMIGIGLLLAGSLLVLGVYAKETLKEKRTRAPFVSGLFYPEDGQQLRADVSGLLEEVPPQDMSAPLYAVLAPHAGYPYSARIAAQAYARIKGRTYKRVVIIAPSHVEPFAFTSIYDGDAYATPLGVLPVDTSFAKKLAKKDPSLKLSGAGHGCFAGRCEHAVEVQLPFLQATLKDPKIVPVVMGAADYQSSRALGVALAEMIQRDSVTQEPDTLIVVSSDLSHFHSYDDAVSLDHKTLAAVENNDYLSLSVNLESGVWEACGGAPLVAAMIATERMGVRARRILATANSGDVTGDKTRVVGYAAGLFSKNTEPEKLNEPAVALKEEDSAQLLSIARESVEAAVRGKEPPRLPATLSKPLQTPLGAFVTLKEQGQLRGCIGFITPAKALAETVREVAASAALKDARFTPVQTQELSKLSYEVSVLSPFRRIEGVHEIQIGRDGLLIRKGTRQGLLLPQVAQEFGWNVPQFVAQTAMKAGLPPEAWKDKDADLFAFSATVLKEK